MFLVLHTTPTVSNTTKVLIAATPLQKMTMSTFTLRVLKTYWIGFGLLAGSLICWLTAVVYFEHTIHEFIVSTFLQISGVLLALPSLVSMLSLRATMPIFCSVSSARMYPHPRNSRSTGSGSHPNYI